MSPPGDDSERAQKRDFPAWLPALLGFTALSVLFTWPLAMHIGRGVIGRHGDNMHFVWMVGWFEEALLERQVNPFFAPQLNYPQGWSLARSEIPVTSVLLGLPFSALFAPVAGYNVAVLLTFVLTGFTMYLWLKHETGSRWAGFVGGAIFSLLPFRVAHFRAGHLNILTTMWFPLYFWGLFDLLSGRSRNRKSAALTGISLGLIGLSSQYYFYATCVLTLLAGGAYLLLFDRGQLRRRSFWRWSAAAVAWSLPLSGLALFPYLKLAAEGSLPSRDVFAVAGGSASVSDFLLPATDHFLWGEWVSETFSRQQWIEGSLYLGLIPVGLAVYGSIRRMGSRLPIFLLLLALFGLMLALGTHLHWNEQLVRLPLPRWAQELVGQGDLAVRLPDFYLFQFFPFFDRMRTFKRAAVFLLFALSGLAGLGMQSLLERLGGPPYWAVSAVLLVFLLETYPGPMGGVAPVGPRPVDRWLQGQPGTGAVAQFPFHLQTDQLHVYYSLEHGRPIIGGFFNAFPPEQYQRIRPVLEEFPNREGRELLDELGVRYLVVDAQAISDYDSWMASLEGLGFEGPVGVGDQVVYRLIEG